MCREMARRHTPLRRYVTRRHVNGYNCASMWPGGCSTTKCPRRKPTIQRIDFLPEEADLYQRITEYISEFYHKYEAERKGLGFIMTIYRRRLTSSFFAVQRSLESAVTGCAASWVSPRHSPAKTKPISMSWTNWSRRVDPYGMDAAAASRQPRSLTFAASFNIWIASSAICKP